MSKHNSSLQRNKLAGLVPPRTSGQAVIGVQPDFLATQDAVNLWELDPPSIEYHADTCSVRDVAGCPTILFGQCDPFQPQSMLNAIAISFPRQQFDLLWQSLDVLRQNLQGRVEARYAGVSALEFGETGIGQANSRRFHCATARIALNADVVMADFYSIAPYVQAQGELTRQLKLGLVRPCIRVYGTPVVFRRMAELGDALVGSGK